MGLFGKSFEDQVQEAIGKVRASHPRVRGLAARIEGKVVTLSGEAPSIQDKGAVAAAFNALVETQNTINVIKVDAPPAAAAPAAPTPSAAAAVPPAPAPPAAEQRIHTVVSGDTLSGLAKRYLGNAGLYMKIFEANKDVLKDPNVIKVGQKLRIPG